MREERVDWEEGGQALDLLVVHPEGELGPRPAVLVAHAWGGRDAFAEGRARALAGLGYVGIGLDLYGIGRRGVDRASSAALMNGLLADPERLGARLAAAVARAGQLPGVDPERLAAVGYCFGGLCVLRMARQGLPLRGVVSFHGLLKLGAPLAARPRARVLVLHGQDDPMVSPAEIGAFAEEMRRVGGDWELHCYPGARHAFTNPAAQDEAFGTVYHPEADRRSWRSATRFLAEVLGPGA